MRARAVILVGIAVATMYVLGTAAMAYSLWYDESDWAPIITPADMLTGWATVPRHVAQYFVIRSWDLDAPQPIALFAMWDGICTALAALVNVVIVVFVVSVFRRRRAGKAIALGKAVRGR